MSTLNGWNISKLTGHDDPVLGGIAYDADRQRLWLTEQDYGVVRLDFRTGDFEMFRYRMEEPDRYGPVAVACDGSIYVGVNNSDKILRFDPDINPLPHITYKSVLGLSSCEDAVAALVDMGNSISVACYNETGAHLWTTQVGSDPGSHYFICNNPILCTEEYIIVLVAQRNIECVFLSYDGRVLERKVINIPTGSWSEDLADADNGISPVGRRYLLDAGFNAKLNSLMMLYAPATGNHGLILVGWPFNEDAEPFVYDIPFWTSRMLVYGSRTLFFGSETYSGPKKIFPIGLRELERLPLDELPFLTVATAGPDTDLLKQLFAEAPAKGNEDQIEEQPDVIGDSSSTSSPAQLTVEQAADVDGLNDDPVIESASIPEEEAPASTYDLSSGPVIETYDPFTNDNSMRFSLNGDLLSENEEDARVKHKLAS